LIVASDGVSFMGQSSMKVVVVDQRSSGHKP